MPPNPHEPELGPDISQVEGVPPRSPRRQRAPVRVLDGMVYISGGQFTMGSEGRIGGEPNERPAHQVVVSPFWIDRTEVTVRALLQRLARGDCMGPTGRGAACTLTHPESPAELPANCVSWQLADSYCRAVGKRLPTEAEWEFAASGGLRARFPWGSDGPSCSRATTLVSNRSGISCSPTGPRPVGSHPHGSSPFGALDMAGNVEEWVADWYGDRYATTSAQTQAVIGPAFGTAHVLRGGGWMSRPYDARVSSRNWGSATEAGPNVGFRCAKD